MKPFELPINRNRLADKKDVQQAVKQICDPLTDSYSKGKARLHIGNTSAAYPDPIAEMEGFSRLLWGIVPLLAGGEGNELWERQLEGIKNGTDPSHEEYWGELKDYDQRIVEMAAFGLALALIPEKIWKPLSDKEKTNLKNWLSQINDHPVHDCNWLFFPVLVNLGFKQVGVAYDKALIERNLDRIEAFYLADGWYGDGIGGHADYYVPFAIHFYSLVYARLMKDDDPERAAIYKERAERFANQFIYWFSPDGSAVPYGRSLTYRFAQSAFWSAMVYAGVETFPYGVMKGLILNNLRWWFSQPVFDRQGILTIGYRYPNLVMAENYNSPGSPYWGLKTFLILALEDDHPFWKAEEKPMPALNAVTVQRPAHLVLTRQEEKSHVAAFNSGHLLTNEHTHTSAKYEKFVYSNVFGFSVPRAEWGLGQGAYDSMLALSEGDNLYRIKRTSEEYEIEEDEIYTRWKPWEDVEVRSWIVPGLPWHVRIHRVESGRKLDAAEGGFALGIEVPGSAHPEKIEASERETEAFASCSIGASGIRSLDDTGTAALVYPNANTNIQHSRTVLPVIKRQITPGVTWLVSAVYGEPGSNAAENWKEAPHAVMDQDELVIYSGRKDRILFQQKLGGAEPVDREVKR